MESGFRRLWRRKKKPSVNNTEVFSSTEYERLNFSPINDSGRFSAATTRYLDKVPHSGKSIGTTDYLSIASDDYPRVKQGSRIQPILIGISRPADSARRPETASSLNTAVQHAADTARAQQDVTRFQSASATGHRRSVSGRSIDILRVVGGRQGYKSRFNEDIAERNMDTASILDANDTAPAYVPTSRYQEEVADRNAGSHGGTRSSFEYGRSSSLATKVTKSGLSSPISPQSPRDLAPASMRSAQDQSAYHSRQFGLRSRDGGSQLPSILQERISEDSLLAEVEDLHERAVHERAVHERAVHSVVPLDVANRHRDTRLASTSKPLPDLPALKQEYEYVMLQQPRPRSSGVQFNGPPAVVKPSVAVATPQPPMRHPARAAVQQSGTSESISSVPSIANPAARAASTISAASNKRTSSIIDRRILDFPNEDGYSESSSTYGYSQYSPVLQQADTGRFGVTSQSHLNNSFGPVMSTETTPIDEPPKQAITDPGVIDSAIQESRQREMRGRQPATAKTILQKISFSGISTLASLSPRIAVEPPMTQSTIASGQTSRVSPIVEPKLNDPDAKPLQTARVEAIPKVQQRSETMSRVQRAAAALEARSASQSPKPLSADPPKQKLVVAEAPSSRPAEVLTKRKSSPGKDAVKSAGVAQPDVVAKAAHLHTNGFKSTREATLTPSKQSATKSRTSQKSPSIYDSPDSLRSLDYTNPGDSFGVRTRDFAVVPTKNNTPSKKKSDQQTLKRTATENAHKASSEARKPDGTSSVKSPLSPQPDGKTFLKAVSKRSKSAAYVPAKSEFDEEAFARKQADAKAALERLKKSLEEDIITLPEPIRPRKNYYAEDDGSPVAPSSIVYPQSILSQSPSRTMDNRTASKQQETSKAPSSFRNANISGERASSAGGIHSRSRGPSTRKAAPPSLKNVEAASAPINHNFLPPHLQQSLLDSSKPPQSPGEISLSSFPIPSSRPTSEHDNVASPSRPIGFGHMRRNSTLSQSSMTSQYSIPFHMIPDRSSSYRDTVIEEDSS